MLFVLLMGVAAGAGSFFAYNAVHRPPNPATLDGQLAWMQTELKLSEAQFERIRNLHRASGPELRSLAQEVAAMRVQLASFEDARRSTGSVDFIEFARFVEARRTVREECLETTRRLILASAEEMTPAQRQRYLGIVALPRSDSHPLAN